MSIYERLAEVKLVPVVVIEDAEQAEPLARALIAGGLPCAEVTFRTAAAAEAIRRMSQVDGLTLGAGTVLTPEQAAQAQEAGAEFIVSPGFNPAVVEFAQSVNLPIAPGISNPTDIEAALGFGLEVVKFFPAEAFGGLKTLKAIAAPYAMMRFIPTGGINANNVKEYLAFEKVIACGGSWMVKKDLIAAGRWDEITRLAAEAVAVANNA